MLKRSKIWIAIKIARTLKKAGIFIPAFFNFLYNISYTKRVVNSMDIDIHVLQSIKTEEETEMFEVNTVGQLIDKQHSYITYTEKLDNIETSVRVKLEENRIRIRRIGELSMDFLFVPTETTQNIYHMANQKAVMDIMTNQLVIKRKVHLAIFIYNIQSQ